MHTTRLAAVLTTGALLIAGCGGTDTPARQTAAGRQPPGGGFLGGANTTKLASALGVSKAKLQSALTSITPQGGPPGGGQGGPPPGANGAPPAGAPTGGPTGPRGAGGPGGGQLAGRLAKKLGLSEAKVTKALQSVMPPRPNS